eukprot:GAHX01002036.1.p1 GENE.GAHX01002036.1~~GAHX01002036.1.p1  ORF type:complete len:712 (-),score=117.21 GAHX01002036.1:26-2161(-)
MTHLKNSQFIEAIDESVVFAKRDELDTYLAMILSTETTTFYKYSGSKDLKQATTSYYKCAHNTESENCIAYVRLYDYSNNKFKISSLLYHNHDTQLDKIKVPPQKKKELINKIKMKIDIREIYRELLMDANIEITKKSEMITLGYLRYLKYRYADSERLSINDLESLKLNVKTVKSNNNDQMFTFLKILKEDKVKKDICTTFIFAFSSPSIKEGDWKGNMTILADATYGTNYYGYSLIVFGKLTGGITFQPFLYIISDQETEAVCRIVLSEFSNFIKFKISASFFMSDMSPIFFNSWCATFHTKPNWLYCMWHMKKAVRRQLFTKERDEMVRNTIEKKLEKLTKITTEKEFINKLKAFEKYCSRNSPSFFEYFSKYYSPVYERWALHARLDCDLNTNMFVEAYFGEFKRTYLLYKSKNRLDFVFKAILIYDKHIRLSNSRRSISKQKQFMGYRQVKALEKHNKAKTLKIDNFNFNAEQITVSYKKHTITLGSCRDCSVNCSILCGVCQICVHRYKCTCLSFQSRKELCKHIHIAHTVFTENLLKLNAGTKEAESELIQDADTHKRNELGQNNTINTLPNEEDNMSIEGYNLNCDFGLDYYVGGLSGNMNIERELKDNNVRNIGSKSTIMEELVNDKLQKKIKNSIQILLSNIEKTNDQRVLRKIMEEIQLLNTYCECENVNDGSKKILNKDKKMGKKQKTQRSFFKNKTNN